MIPLTGRFDKSTFKEIRSIISDRQSIKSYQKKGRLWIFARLSSGRMKFSDFFVWLPAIDRPDEPKDLHMYWDFWLEWFYQVLVNLDPEMVYQEARCE